MLIVDYIQKNAEFLSVTVGAITVLMVSWTKIKQFVIHKYEKRVEYVRKRNDMPRLLENIRETISVMDNRLQTVEKEISPNGGGSMKDALKMVKAEMESIFWLNPTPSFRSTSSGVNILVNEAYCHLCGVSSEGLMKLGWKNFAEDEDQLDDFMRRWLESSKEFSQFSGKLKIKNYKHESRGEWMVKIRPLGPIEIGNKRDFLWHGMLYPIDPVAISYAYKENIPAMGYLFPKENFNP
jgi:PAS domain-containing protein